MDIRGLSRVLAVAANTFRESVRERVLYNLVVFAMLMTLSGLLLGQLSIYQDEKIIKDLGLASMEVFGSLIAVFLGVGLISKEIERRSLYPLLARPLGRNEFLLGKFFGLAFTLTVNVAVMVLGLYATLLATGRTLDLHLLAAVYLIVLGLVLVVALSLAFSAITTSTVMAAVCAVVVVVAGRYSDLIRNMRQVAPRAPGWLLEGIYYLLPNFRNFDIKDRMVYGDAVPWDFMAWSTLYAIVYAGLALSVALAAFRSRQLQ
jgi:ABC-type transport system involved in multi-copper enzyme maturation permease subunit